ncbi:MAG: hypothetical protein AAFQ63_07280 [Cyanobacteria bacterium J06621_11]
MTGRQRQPQKQSTGSPLQNWSQRLPSERFPSGKRPDGGALQSSAAGPLANNPSSVRRSDSRFNSQSDGSLQKVVRPLLSKPLLRVLDQGEQPGDMVTKPKQMALQGQRDVYIARAEIELRNAMQSLAFMTHSEINSLSTLTALSLPKAIAPMFWTINALLQEKFQKPNDHSRIHHRNHDARLLFQQLAQLDLQPWSERTVDYLSPDELPDNIFFPVGHPILGRTYRRHPFKSRAGHYYPVTDYFSMLFKEREQALLSLLGQLGATKITMTPIPATSSLNCQENLVAQLHQKVFRYPQRMTALPQSIDVNQHPWLAGEPSWQSVVRERLHRGALSAQFEFDCDVMGLLKSQIKMIGQLIPELDSMALPSDYKDILTTQILQTRQVQVEFCEI